MIVLMLALNLITVGVNSTQSDDGPIIGVASVIDGDTIEIRGERIRLVGIDAPESAQTCVTSQGETWRCGQRASLDLSDFIGRRTVTCQPEGLDRYRRVLATCSVGDAELGDWMVATGRALAFRRYSQTYTAQECSARVAEVGVWSGSFAAPWDWRRGDRGLVDAADHGPRPCNMSDFIDLDCADFSTQADAQAVFDLWSPADPHRLDRDGNGTPCENLPQH